MKVMEAHEMNGLVKRDWLGHGIQFVGILAVISIPLLIWGNGTNSAVAVLTEKVAAQERADADLRASVNAVTSQLTEANRQLATIAAQVQAIKEGVQRR